MHRMEGFVGQSTPLATTWKSKDKNPLYRCKDVKFCCCSSLKQNIYDKFYIHSVFSIQSFHWRLQLQTRAWKNKFSLKQQTHGVMALPLLKASSNQLQLKNIQEQPMKWPGTAEPTYWGRPVCLHSPQSSVLNKLWNSQVDVVSCLNHAVEESCAPT